MKYLRKIFEDNTEELKDLCDSYFAYLYDEGFEVKISIGILDERSPSWRIKINKPNSSVIEDNEEIDFHILDFMLYIQQKN